jgi:hypothetical protein
MKNKILVGLVIISALFCTNLWAALTSSVQFAVSSNHTTAIGLSTVKDDVGYSINKSFSNGSGTTQVADLVYHASRTLASSTAEDLDFYGTLTDAFGTTLNYARIKTIVIENTSTSESLTVGGDDNSIPFFDPATATVTIPPSGILCLVGPLGGFAVTADTGDILQVTNSAGGSTIYKIHVVGASN